MKRIPSHFGDVLFGPVQEGFKTELEALSPSRVFFIADENTALHCLPALADVLGQAPICTIPAGETHKTLASCERIWTTMIAQGLDRRSVVINVGGGMICDLGGFAASCFQRGIRFVQVPTSLLAMVDAAIGGKNGVDFNHYKNYLGRFASPAFVWVDPAFLNTLPEEEFIQGRAEMIKHALIASPGLWGRMRYPENGGALDWTGLIAENIGIKSRIVSADPFEQGQRKVLNFGHTIGHALESYFLEQQKPISHGLAVTLGMLAEAWISMERSRLFPDDFQTITAFIGANIPIKTGTLPTFAALQPWLKADKKGQDGRFQFSLLNGIGRCDFNLPVEATEIIGSLEWLNTYLSK